MTDTSAAPPLDPETLTPLIDGLAADRVFDWDPDGERHFRIGAEPLRLTTGQMAFFTELGGQLFSFYRALNSLYRRSMRGTAPAFVARWLNQGKPEDVLRLARMGRFQSVMPPVIRPDLLLTADGFKITELDSVPGGIGLTDSLNARYAAAGHDVVGGADGLVDGMARVLRAAAKVENPTVAVVVSDESEAYRDEMQQLALRLKAKGLSCHVLHPTGVLFDESGLSFEQHGQRCGIDVLYRFFELFDLVNIAKSELMMYSARKGTVVMTPPPKPQLEEKLAMGLFHHPALQTYWRTELGQDTYEALSALIPATWVLDPAPMPDHGVIPGLTVDGGSVQHWSQLKGLGQKARALVIKPSGFSPDAWGSRGVVIGHDVSEQEWDGAVDNALNAFAHTPHILQPFHKAVSSHVAFVDEGVARHMRARARWCPYYFVAGEEVTLGGILATLCPEDKKKLHGMREAVIIPCSLPH